MNIKMKFIMPTALLSFFLMVSVVFCADWPMWGYDSGRTNAAALELADNPDLLWTRQLAGPRRAWAFQYEDYYTAGNPLSVGKLSFDVSYEPVAGGGRLYIPSMTADRVSAYSLNTGEELWRYYADGPVRFAPVYWQERIYFAADDGYLYCLNAETGELQWSFSGSFSSRAVLGNERIISIWPVRGGPVLADGVIYFAAGVLPFEGIFINAVCAETGDKVWTNSTSGAIWDLHQHGGAWAYGGPSPQGYLAVAGDKLIVPGGRTPPAVYDRETGDFLYYRQATGKVGKGAGGYRVHARGDWFFNHGMLYALEDGAQYGQVPGEVLTEDSFIGVVDGVMIAHRAEVERLEEEVKDRMGRGAIRVQYELTGQWEEKGIEGLRQVHFKTASHLGVSREGGVAALLALDENGRPEGVVWEYEVEGDVWNMIAADEKLFVVTEEGMIYCFGHNDRSESIHHRLEFSEYQAGDEYFASAATIIGDTEKLDGYAFVYNSPIDFLLALARQTDLHLLAVYDDAALVEQFRRQLDDAGYYGHRVAVLKASDSEQSVLPPYLADLVVVADEQCSQSRLQEALALLRPYGGSLFVKNPPEDFTGIADRALPEQLKFEVRDDFSIAIRQGELPGAGQWTHQYGDAGNRTYADDLLVKPPLGTLWFGGPSNLNILPRHYSGPVPQVSEGRVVLLGVDTISARCVYTGRELWVRDLPGVGHMFTNLRLEERFEDGREVYMTNHPGANVMGSPYVSVEDGIYVIHNDSLFRLEPASGETLVEFRLPRLEQLRRNEWGHLLVLDDVLVAAVEPQYFDEEADPIDEEAWWNATSSSLLVGMNRYDGRVLWVRRAERVGFRHNAIAAGNGRLYAIDGLSEDVVAMLQRRGLEAEMSPVLLALDIVSGETIWETDDGVFGTWLGYYQDRDILLEGGRFGGKRNLPDEPRRNLVARRGAVGETLWRVDHRYSGSLGLHPDMIIPGKPNEEALDPDTGEVRMQEHPLTGELYDWHYHRYYGCGTMNSSRHLIMFRSGAAGFTDLKEFGGTGNLGGFRSGCTNNLIAADGVLNAPDYTRTCTCSYQLQTSLGFIHMPEVEMWTLNRLVSSERTIQSLGINFGAPGNRRENGVLWLEYPAVYGAGPELPAEIVAEPEVLFRHHASWIDNPRDGHAWVGSYGIKNIAEIKVALRQDNPEGGVSYRVTLYFVEPENIAVGDRLFDVIVQGEQLLTDFDITEKAGASRRLVKMQFDDVMVNDDLNIEFINNENTRSPVVSGLEIVRVD